MDLSKNFSSIFSFQVLMLVNPHYKTLSVALYLHQRYTNVKHLTKGILKAR